MRDGQKTTQIFTSLRQRSAQLNQKEAGLPELLQVLLEDSQLEDFYKAREVDTDIIRNKILETYANKKLKSENIIEVVDVSISGDIRDAIDRTQKALDDNVTLLGGRESYLLLHYLLESNATSEHCATFQAHGVTARDIRDYALENFNVKIYSEQKIKALSAQRNQPSSLISQFTSSLNKKALDGDLISAIGREEEISDIIRILSKRSGNMPLLLGEKGIRKASVVEGLAQVIASDLAPFEVEGIDIYTLDVRKMAATVSTKADFEKKFKNLAAELNKMPGAHLFVSELDLLLGSGSNKTDIDETLKEMLQRREVRLIGAMTEEDYKSYVSRDPYFAKMFGVVNVAEPTKEDAYAILESQVGKFEDHYACVVPEKTIKAAVDMAARYITDIKLPESAIDILDEAGSFIVHMSDEEMDVIGEFRTPLITKEMVAQAISKRTGIDLDKLTTSDASKILTLKDALNAAVFDQEEAAEKIHNAYKISRAGLRKAGKPVGAFFFDGPTGVGKTEFAKQLAEHLDMELVRLDMSEYMEKHTVAKLIGSPPGYIGHNQGGQLTSAISKHPHSVLLLDEIEKAHPAIFNAFLQVMDDGRMTDGQGKTVDFSNTIIIMTSNASAGGEIKNGIGFGNTEKTNTKAGAVNKLFAPEFRNRLSGIVPFKHLRPETMSKIVKKIADKLNGNLPDEKELHLSSGAIDWLAKKGYDKEFGARPLERLFEDAVSNPMADIIIENEGVAGKIKVLKERGKNKGLSVSFAQSVSNDNTQGTNPVGTKESDDQLQLPRSLFAQGPLNAPSKG